MTKNTSIAWLLWEAETRSARPPGGGHNGEYLPCSYYLVKVHLLLLKLLLVFLQELLVLLLDDKLLQGLCVLGQGGRLRAPQGSVLP